MKINFKHMVTCIITLLCISIFTVQIGLSNSKSKTADKGEQNAFTVKDAEQWIRSQGVRFTENKGQWADDAGKVLRVC